MNLRNLLKAALFALVAGVLAACGSYNPENEEVYKAAVAGGYSDPRVVDWADNNTKIVTVSAMVGECPVTIVESDPAGKVATYYVAFNGRIDDRIAGKNLTPDKGVSSLPSANEIANVLNHGAIAKARGVTDPGKVPGSIGGVCDPFKKVASPTPASTPSS